MVAVIVVVVVVVAVAVAVGAVVKAQNLGKQHEFLIFRLSLFGKEHGSFCCFLAIL